MSTLIVGGGVSGLACAYWLKLLRPEAESLVLEQGVQVGGKVRTRRLGEFLLEVGPDSFANTDSAILQLCRALDLRSEVRPARSGKRLFLLEGDELKCLPDELNMGLSLAPWSALVNPALSPAGRMRAALQGIVGRSRPPEDEPLGQLVSHRLQEEAQKVLTSPLSGGIVTGGTAPDWAVIQHFPHLAVYRQEGEPAFLTIENGMETLINRLAEKVLLRCQVTVDRIYQQPGGWRVTDRQGDSWCGRDLVLALPAAECARLLQPICPELFSTTSFASGACVYLELSRDQLEIPPNSYGFVSPDLARRPLVACSWQVEDRVLVRAFLRSVEEYTAAQLVELTLNELRGPLKLLGEPRMSHVERYLKAFPEYQVGDFPMIEELESARQSLPGLHWTGPAFGMAGVPQCIHHARQLAREIAKTL